MHLHSINKVFDSSAWNSLSFTKYKTIPDRKFAVVGNKGNRRWEKLEGVGMSRHAELDLNCSLQLDVDLADVRGSVCKIKTYPKLIDIRVRLAPNVYFLDRVLPDLKAICQVIAWSGRVSHEDEYETRERRKGIP
uniref:Uncharacterized protein n=1 Tax=Psilocybe cubensis TaxID=181762 RepID=A0A8H7Y6L3_PSICU